MFSTSLILHMFIFYYVHLISSFLIQYHFVYLFQVSEKKKKRKRKQCEDNSLHFNEFAYNSTYHNHFDVSWISVYFGTTTTPTVACWTNICWLGNKFHPWLRNTHIINNAMHFMYRLYAHSDTLCVYFCVSSTS